MPTEGGSVARITEFTGNNAWASNFAASPMDFRGYRVPTAEHAFHICKTDDPGEQESVASAPTPSLAKRAGRGVTLVDGWDAGADVSAMHEVMEAKFPGGDPMSQLLLDTDDDLLVEGTTWHDQKWGSCSCPKHRAWPGKNLLGKALMRRRSELRLDAPDYWPVVCATGHRPKDLQSDRYDWVRDELVEVARRLRDEHGTRVAVTGMAMGVDLWWADAAYTVGLDVWCYLPFDSQAEEWSDGWSGFHGSVLDDAAWSGSLGEDFDVKLLHARNDWMLRDSRAVVAVWKPERTVRSGTASCVTKARRQDMDVVHIDPGKMSTTWPS